MSAHLYGPPKGAAPSYWQVDAYSELPSMGPEGAVGVLFWSHGLSGKSPTWKQRPQRFVRRFARAGWDVVKVNRNNLHENYWNVSGAKHVADLRERAREARRQGYARIVLAGQSFGGAISLEAASEPGLADGVLAMAPGHGSDACGRGDGGQRLADNLPGLLVQAIGKSTAPRTVLTMADGDECMGFNRPQAALREALSNTGTSFVFLDDTMPIRGHGASATGQFDEWYGDCLVDFMDAGDSPGPGETVCPAPNPVPAYLLPAGYRPPAAGGQGSLLGAWSGSYSVSKRETRNICLFIEDDYGNGFMARTAFGAGSQRKSSMATHRRLFSAQGGDGRFVYARNEYSMTLAADAERKDVSVTIRTAKGKVYRSRLERGCELEDEWPPVG